MSELISINSIVQDYLLEDGRDTAHDKARLMQIGVRCVDELNYDIVGEIKTVRLTPNSYFAIDLPSDYRYYTKIGVCIGGQIYNLSLNDSMCLPHTADDCGNLLPCNVGSEDFPFLSNYFDYALAQGAGFYYYNYSFYSNEYGESLGRLFGLGAGINPVGYFKVWPEKNQIVVSPNLQEKEIVLEYVAQTITTNQALIPKIARETVISWLNWKTSKGGERQNFEREYWNNRRLTKERQFAFTLQDAMDALSFMCLAPKT